MRSTLPSFALHFLLGAASVVSPASAAEPAPIRVALYDDAGAFGKGVPRVTEILGKSPEVKLTIVKGKDIAAGALKDYDVVIFTGGSGSKQAAGIGEAGREEVRQFVKKGGGYIGICGGAYLACSGFSWGLGVLDAKTVSSKWKRGVGDVQIVVNDTGAKTIGLPAKEQKIRYANGPIIMPASRPEVPDYEPMALFRTELSENGTPPGVMVNSPAWVRGIYGKGRVITSSPHPEQTAGMDAWVENAVRWVAGR